MTMSQKIVCQSHGLNLATLIGVVGVFLKYTHQRKKFENIPLKILEIIFEKPGKTEKIRLIELDLALIMPN